MMIDRRTFILNTALVGAAPALASLLSLSSTVQSDASLPSDPVGGTDKNCVVFKIDGWEQYESIAIDGSKISATDPVPNDPTGDQVLISINQSWRTTWR